VAATASLAKTERQLTAISATQGRRWVVDPAVQIPSGDLWYLRESCRSNDFVRVVESPTESLSHPDPLEFLDPLEKVPGIVPAVNVVECA